MKGRLALQWNLNDELCLSSKPEFFRNAKQKIYKCSDLGHERWKWHLLPATSFVSINLCRVNSTRISAAFSYEREKNTISPFGENSFDASPQWRTAPFSAQSSVDWSPKIPAPKQSFNSFNSFWFGKEHGRKLSSNEIFRNSLKAFSFLFAFTVF